MSKFKIISLIKIIVVRTSETSMQVKFMKFSLCKAICFTLFLFIASLYAQTVYAQDSIPEKKILKNTVRINLTNPMIFGQDCYSVGYERTVGNHQSFSIDIGRFAFPRIFSINTDSVKDISSSTRSKGFHISGDYRFYLSKENKYNAPRGVYIGPYVSYNSYSRDFKLSADTEAFTGDLNANFKFRVASLGFQLGYQFIFWKRISLDMILFGPGIAAYKLKAGLDSTLDPDQEAEVFKKINEKLQEKIPGYSLVLDSGSFEKTGVNNTTSLGFRYVVMLGFRF